MPIRIAELSKTYKKKVSALKWINVHALNRISYEFTEGTVYGIIGLSGSGKSTLASVLIGYDEPDSGSIFYENTDVTNKRDKDMKKYSTYIRNVFQDPYSSLNPVQTVEWHLKNTLKYNAIEKSSSYIENISGRFGLPVSVYGKRFVETLSGGERQRLSFLIATIAEPHAIVLDEPFSMIDSVNSMYLLNYLKSEKNGRIIIYIDQNVGRVLYTADRIIVMDSGRFVEDAETERIINDPKTEYTKSILKSYYEIAASMR
ncbi:MAG: ABC transporter ATP-binding protein [Thermoplasmata archaeon]